MWRLAPEDVPRRAALLPQAGAAPAHDRRAPGALDLAASAAAHLHHRRGTLGHDVPGRLHRAHPGGHATTTSRPPRRPPGRYVYEGLWGPRRSRWFFRLVYRWLAARRARRRPALLRRRRPRTSSSSRSCRGLSRRQFIHIIRDGRDAASSHMHKPWLRADDAWSGEREPGGYLHGPWPKFWVETERRDEFLRTSDARRMAWAWRRYTEAGLRDGPPLGPARYHELRYEDARARARRMRASASSTSWASVRKRSRDVVPRRRCQRADGARPWAPGGARSTRPSWPRSRPRPATCCASWATTTDACPALGMREPRPRVPPPRSSRERRAPLRPAHRRRGRDARRASPSSRRTPGRIDEERLAARRGSAAELADAQVVVMQWNRRGWGTPGPLAGAPAALPARLSGRARRHPPRRLRPPRAPAALARSRTPGACAGWAGSRTALVVHSEVEVERLRGLVPARAAARRARTSSSGATLPLSPREARARLGLADRRIVTLLGFVYGRKGHRYAVEAVPDLPDGRRHGLCRRPGRGPQLRLRPGARRRRPSLAWATASASPATSPTRSSRRGSRPRTSPSCPSPTCRRRARSRPGSRPPSRCSRATCRGSGSTSGACRARCALRAAGAGPARDRDQRAAGHSAARPGRARRGAGQELSMERTVERYLEVAREAVAAHGR